MVEAEFRGVQQRPQDIAHKRIARRARCLQVLHDGLALSRRGSAREDSEVGFAKTTGAKVRARQDCTNRQVSWISRSSCHPEREQEGGQIGR